jgi:DNA-binding transcriptional MerR regulator
MSVTIKGQTYYRTSEVCKMAGIGRATLLRWMRTGVLKDASKRDRRGWRLFTRADIERIADEAQKVN